MLVFYPNVKAYISPSALATWLNSRSSFIGSYFKGKKFEGNSATEAGTKIHGLIEGGFLKAEKVFGNGEQEIMTPFRFSGVNVLGRPDDYGFYDEKKDLAVFVDYKTGKDSEWNKAELAGDIKMRATAWLVWNKLGKPEKGVIGYLEWFGTKWNDETKELVPTNEDHAIFHCKYTADELADFEEVIEKAIKDINTTYDKLMNSDTGFIDEELIKEYAELDAKVKKFKDEYENKAEEFEGRMDEIKETIGGQLEFGGLLNHETPFGTFYFKEAKKFEYPDSLEFQTESGNVMTLAVGEEVSVAMSAAKKNYELTHTPDEIKKTVQFKAKKTK